MNYTDCVLFDNKEGNKVCRALSANYCMTDYKCPFYKSNKDYITVTTADRHGNVLKAVKPRLKEKTITKTTIVKTNSGLCYKEATKTRIYK